MAAYVKPMAGLALGLWFRCPWSLGNAFAPEEPARSDRQKQRIFAEFTEFPSQIELGTLLAYPGRCWGPFGTAILISKPLGTLEVPKFPGWLCGSVWSGTSLDDEFFQIIVCEIIHPLARCKAAFRGLPGWQRRSPRPRSIPLDNFTVLTRPAGPPPAVKSRLSECNITSRSVRKWPSRTQ